MQQIGHKPVFQEIIVIFAAIKTTGNDDNGTERADLAQKYLKKLVAKKDDPTLMTKEEFFARVDEAKKGPTYRMLPDEDLTTFLRRLGHEV